MAAVRTTRIVLDAALRALLYCRMRPRSCRSLRAAGALVLGLAAYGCADDGDGASLRVVVGDSAVIAPGFSHGRRGFALAESRDGEVTVVRFEDTCTGVACENEPADRVVATVYDADLALVSGPVTLVDETVDSRLFLAACGRRDGSFGAAWSNLSRLVEGENLDTANVEVAADDGDAVLAHENTIGAQTVPHVACVGEADFAVTWESVCTAVRRTGNVFVTFTPDECATEPQDGVYLQLFDREGNRRGPARAVVAAFEGADEAGVAPLPGGDFLLAAGGLVQVRDDTGAIVEEAAFADGPGDDPLVSCSPSGSCVIAWSGDGVHARIVEAGSLDTARDLVVEEVIFEGEPGSDSQIVLPLEPGLACDADGLCLVTWRSVREITQDDFTDTEELGVFARALDARTEELGEKMRVVAPEDVGVNGAGPSLVSVGSGSFVAARSLADALSLQRLDVR